MPKADLFGNLSINKIHKFLVYIGSILITLSLFFDVKDFNVSILRRASFATLMIGLIIWLLDDIINRFMDHYYINEQAERLTEQDFVSNLHVILWIRLIITLIILFIGFFIVYEILY